MGQGRYNAHLSGCGGWAAFSKQTTALLYETICTVSTVQMVSSEHNTISSQSLEAAIRIDSGLLMFGGVTGILKLGVTERRKLRRSNPSILGGVAQVIGFFFSAGFQ